MPFYEYVCDTCGRRVVQLRPMKLRNSEFPCPTCEGPGGTLSRKLSAGVTVVFTSGGTGAMSSPRKSAS